MAKKSDSAPDKVTRDSASFLGLGIGKAYETKIHKGNATYTGTGVTTKAANRKAGQKYQRGLRD